MTTHPSTENAQDLQTRLQIKLRMCDFTSMYRLLSYANDQRKEAADHIASLEHQLADAIKDAARLDWLETQDCWIGVYGEFDLKARFYAGNGTAPTIRDVCDQSMKESQ